MIDRKMNTNIQTYIHTYIHTDRNTSPIYREPSKYCSLFSNSCIIFYADDILLIATSVTELQCLFDACQRELVWLDVIIGLNVKNPAACGSDLGTVMHALSYLRFYGIIFHG